MSTSDTLAAPAAGLSERARAPRVLRLNPADNLVVAIDPIMPGAVAEGVTAVARVPKGHKMATTAIPAGEPVRKFGQIIGFATGPILPGEHIHTHNCGVAEFARDYHFAEDARPEDVLPVGDHDIVVGEVVHLDLAGAEHHLDPLLFFRGGYSRLLPIEDPLT